MTSRAKRLTLIIGVAALVAVVVGAAMAPMLRAAPAPKTDFTITTKEELVDFGSSGTFTAKGAIQDAGTADGYYWSPELVLTGAKGTIGIDIELIDYDPQDSKHTGTFTIVEADGEYADLVTLTGAYCERLGGHPSVDPLAWRASARGRTSTCWIQRTLNGSITP